MKLSIIFFILCFAIQINAQFSIGIKGGYTNAWSEYGDVELPEENIEIDVNGFNISGLAYLQISEYFKIGFEPGFVRRGAACYPGNLGWDRIEVLNSTFPVDETKLFFNYIELPVFLAVNIGLGQSNFEIQPKIGYGPAFMTSVFRTDTFFGSDDSEVKTEILFNDSTPLNRWDHGIYGGIAFVYNLGKHQIFLESDFNLGLTDVEKFNTTKNRSLDFSLGYLVRL